MPRSARGPRSLARVLRRPSGGSEGMVAFRRERRSGGRPCQGWDATGWGAASPASNSPFMPSASWNLQER